MNEILIYDDVTRQRRMVLDTTQMEDGRYLLLRSIPSGLLCWNNEITKSFGEYPDLPKGVVVWPSLDDYKLDVLDLGAR